MLIVGHRGTPGDRRCALDILNDSDRLFIASPFVYLETMPKAIYHRNASEMAFYTAYFDTVDYWIDDLEAIVELARQESERHGLAAMDALHVAAAHLGEAEVMYTFERKEKPMHRSTLVKLVSLHPADRVASENPKRDL